jgi:integrase
MARSADPWKLVKHAKCPNWSIRFTHEGTRYDRSTRCRSKSKAKEKAKEIYTKVVSGQEVGQAPPEGDLEDLLSEWLCGVEDTQSEPWYETLEVYSNAHWLPRWNDLADLTSQAIQRYIGKRLRSPGRRGKRLSPVTLVKELSGLRQFLKWCKDNGHIAELPTWKAPKATSDYEPVFLSRDEMLAVLAELPSREEHPKKLPVRAFFTVMWATSFRLGTMARIRWKDVDLESGTISVKASQDKKRVSRVVPLTKEAIRELDDIAPGVGLVFGHHDYRAVLRSAARRAGIPEEVADRLANHAVRHSRITDWSSRSKNIAAIQHMAGHKDLASTMRYVHGSLEGARALLEETEEDATVEPEKDATTQGEQSDSGEHSGEQKQSRPRGSG